MNRNKSAFIKSWKDFLKATGGIKPMHEQLGLERISISEWSSKGRGIPAKYFPQIMEKFSVTADELVVVNQSIWARKK